MSETNMTEAEARKIDAEIAKLMAETTKLNKEIKWYEAVILAGGASALTLAIVAVTKLFL
ncbi:hypothetical protein [Shimia aestuarii]|uniref:hypothetical protein n=1 Tax=Shimia aestuarii TaxID=254406 RepID=UPI001FB30F92|nr:hypothetical protein [Shimia aestuarii]